MMRKTVLLATALSLLSTPSHAVPRFGDACETLRLDVDHQRALHAKLAGRVVAKRPPLPMDWRLSEQPDAGPRNLPPLALKLWELSRRSRVELLEVASLGVEQTANERVERIRVVATGQLHDAGLLATRLRAHAGLWSIEALHAEPMSAREGHQLDVVIVRRSLVVDALPDADDPSLPRTCTEARRRALRAELRDVRVEVQELQSSIEETRERDAELLEALVPRGRDGSVAAPSHGAPRHGLTWEHGRLTSNAGALSR